MAEHSDPCRCADCPIIDWGGFDIVVDLDLEKFFDTLNQDFLMNILRERIKDNALIELIKRFLRSGVVLPTVSVRRPVRAHRRADLCPRFFPISILTDSTGFSRAEDCASADMRTIALSL